MQNKTIQKISANKHKKPNLAQKEEKSLIPRTPDSNHHYFI